MSRSPHDRLVDILVACRKIAEYTELTEREGDVVFDAIRIRLVEIGEAVKDLDPATRARAPEAPWEDIARMREHLAHRYFDTAHAIMLTTARTDIPRLERIVRRLLDEDADG